MSILKKKYPGKTLIQLFGELKEGDIRALPAAKYNIGSLRAKAGVLNSEAGYSRYSVNDDRKMTGSIRIACVARD